jgi:hypothetical protein
MAADLTRGPMTGLEDIRPRFRDGALARIMRAGRHWERRAREAETRLRRERHADAASTLAALLAGAVASPVALTVAWLVWRWWVR